MADAYRLAWKGLRWSYDRYGLKGGVAFVVVVGAAYLLLRRVVENAIADTEESSS